MNESVYSDNTLSYVHTSGIVYDAGMDHATPATDDQQVNAADIARLAGVTRAAVSNWRRRHDDFPAAVTDAGGTARFRLAEVRAWLDRQHKGGEESSEVQLWHALRNAYPTGTVAGVADLAELLTGTDGGTDTGASAGAGAGGEHLPRQAAQTAQKLAAETSPAEAIQALIDRLGHSPIRADVELGTDPRLVRLIAHLAGDRARSVLDPACGLGSLLLGVGAPNAQRYGQEAVEAAAHLTQRRAALSATTGTTTGTTPATTVEVRTGDALRDDRWPDLRADLVVCHPPTVAPDWGRDELLIDPRWELALPPRAEGELAWLQHAYAHTAPGGTTIMVMSSSAAYRRTGRRIRAELVRRGALTEVLALPAGLASGHAQPLHLWLLRRPEPQQPTVSTVRMVDLSEADPDTGLTPKEAPAVDVALIELLDDTVDLSPPHHLAARAQGNLCDYRSLHTEIAGVLAELDAALPQLAEGTTDVDHGTVRLGDLAAAGLIELSQGDPQALSDQLDTDFLNGFLHSPANRARATSSSGTHRTDARSASVPRLRPEDQRRYGDAFRALNHAEQQATRLASLVTRAADLARAGLTTGALDPDPPPSPDHVR